MSLQAFTTSSSAAMLRGTCYVSISSGSNQRVFVAHDDSYLLQSGRESKLFSALQSSLYLG